MASSITIKNKALQLSQEEYITLSTTGTLTKDGVTYAYSPSDTVYITPYNGSESSHKYSTEEQVVGTWIDGKPVYEQTKVIPANVSISSVTLFTIPDLDIVVSFQANGTQTNGIWGLYRDFDKMVERNTSTGVMKFTNSAFAFSSDSAIIIRYTKTTD